MKYTVFGPRFVSESLLVFAVAGIEVQLSHSRTAQRRYRLHKQHCTNPIRGPAPGR